MRETNDFDVILRGDDFLLRPWKVEDARWYVESRDDEVFRWTGESRDLTVEEAEAAIRRANESPDAACFAIVDSGILELLGNIALSFSGQDSTTAEIMYWLAPHGRGRGLATRSVKLLCRWAFDSLHLERVTLKTRGGNTRSQSVAERAGFRRMAREDGNAAGDRDIAGGGDAATEGGVAAYRDFLWFELASDR
jgi:RimJ/RimL family protein N-acetyltransferase